jgi:hypothetical protein
MTKNRTRALGLAVIASAIGAPVFADAQDGSSLGDALALNPPQWEFGNTEIRLGGFAAGAVFGASQEGGPAFPGGDDRGSASGLLNANIRIRKTLDNGMMLGVSGDFLVYRDNLSGDNYGNDAVEKAYVFAQTGFGRAEAGQQDGAVSTIALTGPIVSRQINLANRSISLFRDPRTGDDFARFNPSAINLYATSNYAKINYVSPRLFGIQVGASFTPDTVRSPLPFTGNPSNGPDQQHNIWELAAGYTGYFSNVAVGFSTGLAHGSLKNSTPGFDDLTDWSIGTQIAYTLSDVKLSAGGGYREANAYLLNVQDVLKHGDTRLVHLSLMAERGSWLAGFEFSHGDEDGPVDYRIAGYQIAAGYKVNTNMQITAGWQWYDYRKDAGAFYNGLAKLGMNAGFVTLGYEL